MSKEDKAYLIELINKVDLKIDRTKEDLLNEIGYNGILMEEMKDHIGLAFEGLKGVNRRLDELESTK